MRNRLTASIALLVVFASFYALTYVLILNADSTFYLTDGHAFELRVTSYHFGGRVAEAIYAPANWLDRQLRPNYWVRDEGPGYVPAGKFKLRQEAVTSPMK